MHDLLNNTNSVAARINKVHNVRIIAVASRQGRACLDHCAVLNGRINDVTASP